MHVTHHAKRSLVDPLAGLFEREAWVLMVPRAMGRAEEAMPQCKSAKLFLGSGALWEDQRSGLCM